MATLKIENKEVKSISIGGKELKSFSIGGKDFSFSSPVMYIGGYDGLKKVENGKLVDVDSNHYSDGWMLQADDGNVYVMNKSHIISAFDGVNLTYRTSLSYGDGGFIYQVNDGTIYIGSHTKLYTWSGYSETQVLSASLEGGYMYQVADGTIYVGETGYSGSGVKKLVGTSLVDVASYAHGDAFMTQTSDGKIYIGTAFDQYGTHGLFRLDGTSLIQIEKTDSRSYEFMTQLDNGDIYVGHSQGLSKFNGTTLTSVSTVSMQGGFMTQGSDGEVYVGTYNDGIKKLVNGALVDFDSAFMRDGFAVEIDV